MNKESDYYEAIEAIRESGEILRKHFGNINPLRSKSDFAVDVVTALDTEIEEFLTDRLKQSYPSIGFRGEELGVKQDAEKVWLVDPIDGTAHFIRGIPFCTTMTALVDKGEVVFSIIYDFVRRDLYTAEKGKGAQLNGNPIKVSCRPLKEAYIAVETNLEYPKNATRYISLRKKCVTFTTINCGFEFGLVASGKIDGRISMDPYGEDWDYAAGTLLVAEAGGVVANIGQKTYNYRNHNFLATNRVIYEELTASTIPPLFPLEKS